MTPNDFTIADEPARKPRRAPLLTGRAAQDQSIAAILDNGLRLAMSVRI
jgi:hypothetical protein